MSSEESTSSSSEEYDPMDEFEEVENLGRKQIKTEEQALLKFKMYLFKFYNYLTSICEKEEERNLAEDPDFYDDMNVMPSQKISMFFTLMNTLLSNENLIRNFVNHVIDPYADKIEARDEDFFLYSEEIYAKFNIPAKNVKFFKDLWDEESDFHLNSKEKEMCFKLFDRIIEYGDLWVDLSGFVTIEDLKEEVVKHGKDKSEFICVKKFEVDRFSDFGYNSYKKFLQNHFNQ